MEQILQFLLNNKYLLPVVFIGFVILFIGLKCLIQNICFDSSYSGHTYSYFEESLVETIIALLVLILGIATIVICCFYIKIN